MIPIPTLRGLLVSLGLLAAPLALATETGNVSPGSPSPCCETGSSTGNNLPPSNEVDEFGNPIGSAPPGGTGTPGDAGTAGAIGNARSGAGTKEFMSLTPLGPVPAGEQQELETPLESSLFMGPGGPTEQPGYYLCGMGGGAAASAGGGAADPGADAVSKLLGPGGAGAGRSSLSEQDSQNSEAPKP